MESVYFLMIKKMLKKNSLSKEQVDYILFMLDEDIQEHFKLKELKLESKIKELEFEKTEMEKEKNSLEIENESLRKRMEVLTDTNKLLLHQLEQRDATTNKTLESIKDNLLMGQEVINSIQNKTSQFIEYNQKQQNLLEHKKENDKGGLN